MADRRGDGIRAFEVEREMPVPVQELSEWHARPGSLDRLRPPWLSVEVLESAPRLQTGGRVVLRFGAGPTRRRWTALITDYRPGELMIDEQIEGPFERWRHVHRFLPAEEGRSRLRDEVVYELPLGTVGNLLGSVPLHLNLERLFRFRHQRTHDDLLLHSRYSHRPRLTVAISGASGLLGTALSSFLASGGHRVLKLVRRPPRASDEVFWDPQRSTLDPRSLEGVDAVVNLSGRNPNAPRWTAGVKRDILLTRVRSTSLIAHTVALLDPPPTLISNSGSGYYGNRGNEVLDEQSEPGSGFPAEVSRAWEQALTPAREAGARVVVLRTAPVLSGYGGMLSPMLLAFRAGVGGVIAEGAQWVSWIALEDYLGVVLDALYDEQLAGVVAAVSPRPVTNREFVKTLGRVLRRPTVIPLPAFAVSAIFGEKGQRLLVEGHRVVPGRLLSKGHRFLYPDLEPALRAELGRLRPN